MKNIFANKLFLFGIMVRLLLLVIVIPQAPHDWYVPFMQNSLNSFSPDPWQSHIAANGVNIAFPYGYAMWLFLLPLSFLASVSNIPIIYGYGCTLLLIDFSMLIILQKLFEKQVRKVIIYYWLSPIVLVSIYWLGYNDIIPITLLVLSLLYTKQFKLFFAGFLVAAAISAKLSMVIALPIFLIYLFRNKSLKQFLFQFLKGLIAGVCILILPFAFSRAGIHMLLSNPEIEKIYNLSFQIGSKTTIFILPLVYSLIIYTTWRIKRLNFVLFYVLLGISFFLVVLLTPASPGWFIWILPLFVYYQLNSDRISLLLIALFSFMWMVIVFFEAASPSVILLHFSTFNLTSPIHFINLSLASTAFFALGIILFARIWREVIMRNDYFRMSRKPFVIGIAGDSGSGKDTLSDAITGLFGKHSISTLSGDDYHLWDRQKPMWQIMTHLNPLANDLEGFSNDLLTLANGKAVFSRHYNHTTGKMSRPIKIDSNDFIIASGLHSLYLPILRELYNLSIFLDIDEDLRKYLKIQRDVNLRGHSISRVLGSIAKREPDAAKFIRPQAEHCDLIFSLQPGNPNLLNLDTGEKRINLKLHVLSRNGLNERVLTRVLVGICGLRVDMVSDIGSKEVKFTVDGEVHSQDMEMAAKILFPNIMEFLDITPKWEDGVLGLMQLITLSHINQFLNKRLI